MSPLRLLVVSVALASICACFNQTYCDGGSCPEDGGAVGIGGGAGGGATVGGGGGSVTGGGGGGGIMGGGSGGDAGAPDAGDDAGTPDAGCGGAAQLDIVPPAQLIAGVCSSAPLKVRVFDACGAPFFPQSALPVTLTTSSATLQRFSDNACTFEPFAWAIPAAASGFDVYLQDPNPGTPMLTATSPGVDAGSVVLTIACPASQRACPTGCVPANACCSDTECNDGGVAWVCNASSRCVPPPCVGFPANCTTFDDRTASAASRTITFNSAGYVPKCMRVTTSQDVTFAGSFTIHPLVQICGPSDAQLTTTFGNMKTARFSSFGTYGYRCANHPAFEQGAIRTP